jgi:transposase
MDVNKSSLQVERLEIVETGRRRRWSEDEKFKIVFESLQSPGQMTVTARRYGISRSQLYLWRRAFRATQAETVEPQSGFVPATITADPQPPAAELATPVDPGRIEIDFSNGARMRVTGAIDGATLAAALRALSDGRRSR